MFITEKDIDKAFENAGVVVVDKECQDNENHISKEVLEYLENKWGNLAQYEKENERLKKIGKELLKEIVE